MLYIRSECRLGFHKTESTVLTLLTGGSGKYSASKVIEVVGQPHFPVIIGLGSLFPHRMSVRDRALLPDAVCIFSLAL